MQRSPRKGRLNRMVTREETGAPHHLPKGTPVIESANISSSSGIIVRVNYSEVASREYVVPVAAVDWRQL